MRTRARFESLIGLAAPVFDLVLGAGERISRIVGSNDDPIPIRASGESFELHRKRPAQLPKGSD